MIRSVLVVVPTAVRTALCLATVAALSAAANAASPRGNQAGLTGYSMTPSAPTDHYVAGKYDKSGNYIPPHYQRVAKPPFHGYFFKKKPGDTNADGPMGITAKSH